MSNLDRERMRELGRRGGIARAAKARAARGPVQPYGGSILDLMDMIGLEGQSWAPWRAFLRAVFGLPMSPEDLAIYTNHTGREAMPRSAIRTVYAICGRRAGKTRIASLVAVYAGIRRDYSALLAPGELATIPLLSPSQDQAAIALGYVRGMLHSPALVGYVKRFLRDSIELRTGVRIVVKAASMRTTRGFSTPCIVADELAHWRSDESSEPDREVLAALVPGMLALPEPLLLGLSTPYSQSGVLYQNFDQFYGQDTPDILIWQSPSIEMNNTLNEAAIARELEADPEKNAAEYLATFRTDVQSLVSPEAVERVMNRSRPLELAWRANVRYCAHVDPSGGASDSACLSIAHKEGERAILDVAREWRAPHVPEEVVGEMAALLRAYHLQHVITDHYAPGWVVDAFRRRQIECRVSARAKSELYLAVVGPINSARVELPHETRLKHQLLGLERRTARGGKDSVDHRVGAKDDLINSACGALAEALRTDGSDEITADLLHAMNLDFQRPSQWSGVQPQYGSGDSGRQYRSVFDDMPGRAGGGLFGNNMPRPDIAR